MGRFAAVLELLPHRALDLVEVVVEIAQCAVFSQQFDGRLVADALHAGDVIADVAHQRLVVNDLVGPHSKIGHDLLRVVYLAARAGSSGRQFDLGVVVDQLQQVAVAGDDVDRYDATHLGRYRAQHVVGLEPFQLEDGDLQCADDFLDAFDLYPQLVGHLLAGALVGLEQFVAEGCPGVETDGQILRRFGGQDEVEQHARETVGCVGRFALLGREGFKRQGEEHSVGQRVAVDEHQSFRGHNAFLDVWRGECIAGFSRSRRLRARPAMGRSACATG